MLDTRKQKFVRLCQQSQDANKSICLFGSTCEKQRYRHDFGPEFVGVVQILDNRIGYDAN